MVGTVEAVTAHVWQLEYNLGTHFSYKYGSSRCIEHADKWLCIFRYLGEEERPCMKMKSYV